uniref:Uncharacterized protein n=1 Tax=Rhizophora mucronata TaxID=61149 RepID=A0A2P2QL62_RHIMU
MNPPTAPFSTPPRSFISPLSMSSLTS